jgi:probable DNA repair protein
VSAILAARAGLARHLLREYARVQTLAGGPVFPTPAIYSWNGWLRKHWAQLAAVPPAGLPALLSPRQERLVWERVLRESPESSAILDLSAAAALAASAHSLAHSWRIPLSGPAYGYTDDSAAFERWQSRVSGICRDEGWAPACFLPELLEPYLDKSEELHLAGFHHATPQQLEFFGRFPNRRIMPPPAVAAQIHSFEFRDAAAEWRAAAEWAAAAVESNPAASIAIVAAETARHRSLAAQALDRCLPGAWRFTAGIPLAAEPLVASALNLLEFLSPYPPLSAIGANLLSPYIAGVSAERFARAAEDARLRARRGPSVPLREAVSADRCPRFHAMTAAWLDRQKSLPTRQSPGAWARDFHALLATFRWTEEVALTAREYSAHEAWRDALSEFASLERVIGPLTASEALSALTNLIAELSFEDPGSAAAPVEIMPPEEAAGGSFTHVWLSGFHDHAWPPPASAHPFLPVSLQRKHGVPQSSTRLSLERAEAITAELLRCGETIIVAHARFDKDREQRCSHLLPKARTDLSVLQDPRPGESVVLESLLDETAPPLPAGETHLGGVKIFQWQSCCPFHAFAEFRLHARPLEDPPTGFDPRDRGALLHTALDYCWKDLKSSAKLKSLDPRALNEVVLGAVDRALIDKWVPVNPLGRQMQSVERERLTKLLCQWLSRERERREGFRVLEAESERPVQISGLGIHVRIDRVDQLDDGSVVLIDYKSSKKVKSAWAGGRPAEPQLPLYAVTAEPPVAGVAFATVRPGECDLAGHSVRNGILDGGGKEAELPPIEDWRSVLSALAESYLRGDAPVDPANNACDICGLQRFCRIHESEGDGSDE